MKIQATLPQRITKDWVENFIIPHKLCPFAKSTSNKASYMVRDIYDGLIEFQTNKLIDPPTDTYFIQHFFIFPKYEDKEVYTFVAEVFSKFLDFLEDYPHEDKLSTVYFHPKYQHDISEDEDKEKLLKLEDPRNYSNRSPFPTIHVFLKEPMIQACPNPEKLKLLKNNVVSNNDNTLMSISKEDWIEHEKKYKLR